MYNRKIQQQITYHAKISEIGVSILKMILDEYNKLDTPSTSICSLADNNEKILIKLIGVWVVVGVNVESEKLGTLTIYSANRWSTDWREYTLPLDNTIRFDDIGNVMFGNSPLLEPERYGLDILEYVLKVGRDHQKFAAAKV